MLTRLTLLLVAVLLPLAGCNAANAPNQPGQVVLHGDVLDARSGKPVPCDEIYLHFFCDDVGHQESLEKEGGSSYEVEMPGPVVRVRVFDPTMRYHLFEQTVTVPADGLDFDIPLQPTDYVVLRLNVIDGTTGKPLRRAAASGSTTPPPVGSGGPLFTFSSEGGEVGRGYLTTDEAGSLVVRVPRAPLEIQSVNSPLSVQNGKLDLTDCTDDETTYELRME